MDGTPSVQAIARAKEAPIDERLSLLGMLLDRVLADMKDVMERGAYLKELLPPLKVVKAKAEGAQGEQMIPLLGELTEGKDKQLHNLQTANALSDADRRKLVKVIRFLSDCQREVAYRNFATGEEAFAYVKEKYDTEVDIMRRSTEWAKGRLEALFAFVEEAFAQGNEMLILVTELTVDNAGAQFIATFGCEPYSRHSQELMLSERSDNIKAQIAELGL